MIIDKIVPKQISGTERITTKIYCNWLHSYDSSLCNVSVLVSGVFIISHIFNKTIGEKIIQSRMIVT